ncbi:hypothetical protein MTR67_034849 [Solanum verrucosum]|uniref:Uncharacterized protein n=1 Tax=Solanum verrucosum TaxID=315347 RepID=A0AAF0ZLQ6_SOLVR|nr:hypothetical protein MTR67_034849 [Solanum verrucosum]
MERMNGKFTFGDLDVVLSVDGSMECYPYIAQSIAGGLLQMRLNVKVMGYMVDYVLM